MNRIFKVVWSKVRKCYVVVSEYGRSSHKKSSTVNQLAAMSSHRSIRFRRGAGVVLTVLACATPFVGGGTAFATGTVLAGDSNMASGDYSSVSGGWGNTAKSDHASVSKRDIQDMGSRLTQDIDRAGANAAALAALHPLDYDPDNKMEFAGGYGHYRGANAGALAAFYHPDENVILSLGGTMGNGPPMVNAGVTFKLGPKGHTILSRTALTNALRKEQQKNKVAMAEIQNLNSKVQRLENMVQTLMAKADK